ncbi:hypothetical protein QBC35DRAFT_501845 [Podospora australis]|uniref:Secreted protein n=1 Tax=Podospora australis TaxID=1536484 RepID=A0AAN6WR48_9PEZI|nr:hypothetical protein QBC35DRAFT_501845 [Podospora australis]
MLAGWPSMVVSLASLHVILGKTARPCEMNRNHWRNGARFGCWLCLGRRKYAEAQRRPNPQFTTDEKTFSSMFLQQNIMATQR